MKPKYKTGDTAFERGYVGKLPHVLGKSVSEIEKTLGYGPGQLAGGYYLLLLRSEVEQEDFEFRGITLFVNGIPAGQSKATEQLIRDGLSKHPSDRHTFSRLKSEAARDMSTGKGADRICKVVRKVPTNDYVPGEYAPQWTLTKTLEFVVVAEVRPGQVVIRLDSGAFFVGTRAEADQAINRQQRGLAPT